MDTNHNIVNDVQVRIAGAAVAAANNTNNLGGAIDTLGFDGVLFAVLVTDSTATGTVSAEVEQCDTSDGTYAPVDGDPITVTSGVNDDLNGKYILLDVFKPGERFLKLRRRTGVANGALGEAIAILYGAHERPVALGDALARLGLVSPAET